MNICTIMWPSVTLGGAYDGWSLQMGGDTASATRESWSARRGECTEAFLFYLLLVSVDCGHYSDARTFVDDGNRRTVLVVLLVLGLITRRQLAQIRLITWLPVFAQPQTDVQLRLHRPSAFSLTFLSRLLFVAPHTNNRRMMSPVRSTRAFEIEKETRQPSL